VTDEKWQDLIEGIRLKFGNPQVQKEEIIYSNPVTGKNENWGWTETIIFETPEGRRKLERTKKKIILEQKMHYHRKKSGAVKEYIFSDTEYSDIVKFYKETGREWQEIEFRA